MTRKIEDWLEDANGSVQLLNVGCKLASTLGVLALDVLKQAVPKEILSWAGIWDAIKKLAESNVFHAPRFNCKHVSTRFHGV